MATNFPTSLDTLTNPTATDQLATVDHASQHANTNDAVEAIQAKVGANSSSVAGSHDYKITKLEIEHNSDGSHKQVTGMDGDTYITGNNNAASGEIDMIKVNTSDEVEVGANLDIASNTLKVDTVAESGSGSGVTVDGVLLKDNEVSTSTVNDTGGNEVIITPATTGAVNEITVTNAATTNDPQIGATGGDTNIHLALSAKGSAVVKTKTLRQDNTTNSYQSNTITQSGWGQINGDASARLTGSVSFGITFTAAPIVMISRLGNDNAGPASVVGDFDSGPGGGSPVAHVVTAGNITTTGFDVQLDRNTGTYPSGTYFGYSWYAIGQFD